MHASKIRALQQNQILTIRRLPDLYRLNTLDRCGKIDADSRVSTLQTGSLARQVAVLCKWVPFYLYSDMRLNKIFTHAHNLLHSH